MRVIKIAFQSLVVLLMVALFVRGVVFMFGTSGTSKALGKDQIAVIDASGMILESDSLISKFRDLEQKSHIKGYILRVNSPGGLVTPSQEIYEYLLTLKKPLYVSMGSTAASGGYMISLPANKIYAMPSTVTGSIGVIMQIPNYEGLYDKIGLTQYTIKSGRYKDSGNPTRPMTPEDEAVLSAVVMDMYEQFVQAVSTKRNMSLEETRAVADGRVYTGRMAKEIGLVDELGSWRDVFIAMKHDLGLPNAQYIEIDDPMSAWKKMFSKTGLEPANSVIQSVARPTGFYFMADF